MIVSPFTPGPNVPDGSLRLIRLMANNHRRMIELGELAANRDTDRLEGLNMAKRGPVTAHGNGCAEAVDAIPCGT